MFSPQLEWSATICSNGVDGEVELLVNVCGWEGAILLQVLHKSRVASMSADSPGQWTMPRALFFIETTPWCPPWSSWSTLFRRGRGMTILSLDMITPSLLYSERRSPKNWAVALSFRDHAGKEVCTARTRR